MTLSKNIGEERTELELLPQCWEQVHNIAILGKCSCMLIVEIQNIFKLQFVFNESKLSIENSDERQW